MEQKVWQSQCLGVRPAHTTMSEVIKHSMHSSAPRYYTLPRLSLTQFLFKTKIADMTSTSAGYCFSNHDTSSTFSVASPEKRGDVLSIIKYMKGKTSREHEKNSLSACHARNNRLIRGQMPSHLNC
ncbi:hypothetical protein ACB098_03G050500 [Castanea mollissima]